MEKAQFKELDRVDDYSLIEITYHDGSKSYEVKFHNFHDKDFKTLSEARKYFDYKMNAYKFIRDEVLNQKTRIY